MALVTIRILDGPERGRAFHQITTPVTIGREEGNIIQLNDERVSRYHMKIHEDGGAMLLTDLQSTNGTRVNGEVVQVWQLRPGDIISTGRSVLVFGSTDEIARRLATLEKDDLDGAVPMGVDSEEFQYYTKSDSQESKNLTSNLFELEIFQGLSPDELAPLHLLIPPAMPTGLAPLQAAQLAEFLQYIHLRLRYLASTVRSETSERGDDGRVTLSAAQWQNLLDLHEKVSKYLNSVSEP